MSGLSAFGWTDALAVAARESGADRVPARVVAEHRSRYQLMTEAGERQAQLAGRFRHETAARGEWPAVGDWVLIDADLAVEVPRIHVVLPRRSKFSRKQAGDRT